MRIKRELGLALVVYALSSAGAVYAGQVTDTGLSAQDREAIVSSVMNSTTLDSAKKNRYRIFGVQSTLAKSNSQVVRQAHTVLYDYTDNKTYHVINDITDGIPGNVIATEVTGNNLPPNAEEYAEARAMISNLEQMKKLSRNSKVVVQDGFPIQTGTPCNVNRCIQMQINDLSGQKPRFVYLVTVDLSAQKIVEVRKPQSPTAIFNAAKKVKGG